MKAKLTITVEETLIPRSKMVARSRGISLSSLIETALGNFVEQSNQGGSKPLQSFSDRWKGQFAIQPHTDARSTVLKKRLHL